jgi:hypothetical protein
MFEEVQLRFLVVGHIHKDIDGSFGYLSKTLHEQNSYILANLMQGFMISQDSPSILQFIQKIFNLNLEFRGISRMVLKPWWGIVTSMSFISLWILILVANHVTN